MNNEADQRTDAQRVIDKINTDLKKWETWFPDEMSSVEVPRKWLLALKAYAEIGLALSRACDDSDDEHVSCSVVCSSDKCKWRGRRNLRKFGPCPKCGGLLEESDLPPYSLAEEL